MRRKEVTEVTAIDAHLPVEVKELKLNAVVASRVLKACQLNKPAWFLVIEYRYCMVLNVALLPW